MSDSSRGRDAVLAHAPELLRALIPDLTARKVSAGWAWGPAPGFINPHSDGASFAVHVETGAWPMACT